MAGKPACQFISQPPAFARVALLKQGQYLVRRAQYRRVLIRVAVTCGEAGLNHPVFLFAEVCLQVFNHSPKAH